MDRGALERWIAGYERAWRSPGTDALTELFAPEATYRTAPFEAPHRGLAEVGALWERERSSADEVFAMEAEVVAVEGDTGVARLEVTYGDPVAERFLDLWIVSLDAHGRCTAFEEWPLKPPKGAGGFAAGPSG